MLQSSRTQTTIPVVLGVSGQMFTAQGWRSKSNVRNYVPPSGMKDVARPKDVAGDILNSVYKELLAEVASVVWCGRVWQFLEERHI